MAHTLDTGTLDELKLRIASYYAGWGFERGRAHAADARHFYAPDRDLVLYDTQPPVEGFPDVESLHRGVAERAAAAGIRSVRFAPKLDAVVGGRIGEIAWTLTPYSVTATLPDGRELALDPLQTHVWERRGRDWLIVHEHTAPSLGDRPPTSAPSDSASLPGPDDLAATAFVDRYLARDDAIRPDALIVDPRAARPLAGSEALAAFTRDQQRDGHAHMAQRRGAVRLWTRKGVVWATFLLNLSIGERLAVGRETLVIATETPRWRILHAHRSVPFVAPQETST